MRPNPLLELWKNDKTAVNAWITIPSSWTAEVLAHVGFDAMTIDAQHGLATDHLTILTMLQAISTTNTVPFVRVPWNDPAYLMRMLDAGAYGVICPMINNRQETENFVQACRYVPQGFRSYGPVRASVYGGSDYFQEANNQVVTLAMIETPDALKNIEDMAQTPNLTGFYVGPWDLSISLRLSKIADFQDAEFLKILDKILNVCAKNNLVAGIQCNSPENAVAMSALGFRFITAVSDTTLLKTAAQNGLERFRKGSSSPENLLKSNNPYA